MKAKIILNSNLLSKNAFLHETFGKNQISKIFVSILMKFFKRKFFKNVFLQPPKFLFHNGFKHQKWKLHEDLTPIPPSMTQLNHTVKG